MHVLQRVRSSKVIYYKFRPTLVDKKTIDAFELYLNKLVNGLTINVNILIS